MANIGNLIAHLGVNTKGLKKAEKDMNRFTKNSTKAMNEVKKSVLGLTVAFSAFALGIKVFIKFGANFERSMRIVKVVSGATGKEFDKLTAKAKEMGETTEFTGTQSADALKFLSMAGLEATQSLEALPLMLDLATAGQIGLAAAADISTNIMTQMGLEVRKLTRVNDALVAVQSSANTNIYEAAEAFIYGGIKAKSFGVSVEELSALIGLLANSGIKGSMAGTTLSQSMIRLLTASGEAKHILEKYGIAVADNTGKLRNYIDILRELANSEINAMEIAKLFGARASNIQIILDQGAEAMDEYIRKIYASQGAAKAAADTIRTDFKGALDEMISSIQGAILALWELVDGPLKALVKGVTGFVRIFAKIKPLHPFEGDATKFAIKALENELRLAEDIHHIMFYQKGIEEETLRISQQKIDTLKQRIQLLKDVITLEGITDSWMGRPLPAATAAPATVGSASSDTAAIQAAAQQQQDWLVEDAMKQADLLRMINERSFSDESSMRATLFQEELEQRKTKTDQMIWEAQREADLLRQINDVSRAQELMAMEEADKAMRARAEERTKLLQSSLSAASDFFGALYAITGKSSKKLFALTKIASISSAVMDTYAAFTKTLASVPYPFNIAAAVSVLAMGMSKVAAIKGTSFGSGGGSGGGGGGGTYPVSPTTGFPEIESGKGGVTNNFYFEGEMVDDKDWLLSWADRFTEAVENNDIYLVASAAKSAEEVV